MAFKERDKMCVNCVYLRVKERERGGMLKLSCSLCFLEKLACVSVSEREKERLCVCVCVCLCAKEKECVCEREFVIMGVYE